MAMEASEQRPSEDEALGEDPPSPRQLQGTAPEASAEALALASALASVEAPAEALAGGEKASAEVPGEASVEAVAEASATRAPAKAPAEDADEPLPLDFTQSDFLFSIMARIYIKRELFKYGPLSRWVDAMKEFYDGYGMDGIAERTYMQHFRKSFNAALAHRIKKLPTVFSPEKETEEENLCRQIQIARGRVLAIANAGKGSNNNSKTEEENYEEKERSRKRKRRSSNGDSELQKNAASLDIEMTEGLKDRIETAEKHLDDEKKAVNAVREAEKAVKEAQKKLKQAQEHKEEMSQMAHMATSGISDALIDQDGPWIDFYKQLRAYYEQKGTCLVRDNKDDPRHEKLAALRKWTLRQRQRYHLKAANPNKLPWYLVRMLEDLQFPFEDTSKKRRSSAQSQRQRIMVTDEDIFRKNLAELREFKEEHGHCAVPRGYKRNSALANWLKRIRAEGAKFRKDPASANITEEQMRLLDDLGIVWENQNQRRSWEDSFNDWLQFKEDHGKISLWGIRSFSSEYGYTKLTLFNVFPSFRTHQCPT